MNINLGTISGETLRKAAGLQDQIVGLQRQLNQLLGAPVPVASVSSAGGAAPRETGGRRNMSADARKRISLAQKARWAQINRANKKSGSAGGSHLSLAARKRISESKKAYWQAKRAEKNAEQLSPDQAAAA